MDKCRSYLIFFLVLLFFIMQEQLFAKGLKPGESFTVYNLSNYLKYEQSLDSYWHEIFQKLSARFDHLEKNGLALTAQNLMTRSIRKKTQNYESSIEKILLNEPFFKNNILFSKMFSHEIGTVYASIEEILSWYCVGYARHIPLAQNLPAVATIIKSIISTEHVTHVLRSLQDDNALTKENIKRIFCAHPTLYILEKYNNDGTLSIGCYVMPRALSQRFCWALSENVEASVKKLASIKNYFFTKTGVLTSAAARGISGTREYCSQIEFKKLFKKKYMIAALLLIALAKGLPVAIDHKDEVLDLLNTLYAKIPSRHEIGDWVTELWYYTKAKITGLSCAEDCCPASDLTIVNQGCRGNSEIPASLVDQEIHLSTQGAIQDPTFCSDLLRGETNFSCRFDRPMDLSTNPWNSVFQNFSPRMQQVLTESLKKLTEHNKAITESIYSFAHNNASMRSFIAKINELLDKQGLQALGDNLSTAWSAEVATLLPAA